MANSIRPKCSKSQLVRHRMQSWNHLRQYTCSSPDGRTNISQQLSSNAHHIVESDETNALEEHTIEQRLRLPKNKQTLAGE
jgi:hypothetical protein